MNKISLFKCSIIFFSVMALVSCVKSQLSVDMELVKIEKTTNAEILVFAYKLPKGIFRGALWPTLENNHFRIWYNSGKNDKFIKIPSPGNFLEFKLETNKKWTIKCENENNICTISNYRNTEKVLLKFSENFGPITFSIMRNEFNEDLIIFMNNSEEIIDVGIFGYLIMKPAPSTMLK